MQPVRQWNTRLWPRASVTGHARRETVRGRPCHRSGSPARGAPYGWNRRRGEGLELRCGHSWRGTIVRLGRRAARPQPAYGRRIQRARRLSPTCTVRNRTRRADLLSGVRRTLSPNRRVDGGHQGASPARGSSPRGVAVPGRAPRRRLDGGAPDHARLLAEPGDDSRDERLRHRRYAIRAARGRCPHRRGRRLARACRRPHGGGGADEAAGCVCGPGGGACHLERGSLGPNVTNSVRACGRRVDVARHRDADRRGRCDDEHESSLWGRSPSERTCCQTHAICGGFSVISCT